MTRLERAQRAQENAAKKLEASKKKVAVAEANEREKDHKARDKRRYHIGTLADNAGWFALENATIGQLFALLAPLVPLPDPVAVLEELLAEPCVFAMAEADGDEEQG